MSTIEEIKQRRAAITPGTWAVETTPSEPFRIRNVMFSAAESETSGIVGFICWRDDTGERVERDFDFIANAPTDIDVLLAEIERLDKQNAVLVPLVETQHAAIQNLQNQVYLVEQKAKRDIENFAQRVDDFYDDSNR